MLERAPPVAGAAAPLLLPLPSPFFWAIYSWCCFFSASVAERWSKRHHSPRVQRPVWKSQQTGLLGGRLGAGAASWPPPVRRCLCFFFPFCCCLEPFDRCEERLELFEPRELREPFEADR